MQAASAHKGSLQQILGWADASSEAIIWVAPRGSDDFKEALKISPPGLGVIGLTDVLISCGSIDRFIDLIRSAGRDKPPAATSDAISEIVMEACRPVLVDAVGVQLDIRLPRVSSDRARRMIEDWTELPPGLFLPLGAIAYIQSILRGLAAAAKEAHHERVTVLIGGIVDASEFYRFKEETKRVGSLAAGAVLQNSAALEAAVPLARRGERLWIDVVETVRTAHGFSTEIVQAQATLDAYVSSGQIPANPFKRLPGFLESLLSNVLSAAGSNGKQIVGIDCAADHSAELIVDLYRSGFRRFAAPASRRDEIRLLLGKQKVE